jgi:hypothetical protein
MSFINKFLFNTLFNNHEDQDDKLKIVKNEINSQVVLINNNSTICNLNKQLNYHIFFIVVC